jgi:hypothetical protein
MKGKDKTHTINMLKAELIKLESNADMRRRWLRDNLDSPRFEEVRRDLSIMETKIRSREDRLEHLSKRSGYRKCDVVVEPCRIYA